jgi:hypothetical protein
LLNVTELEPVPPFVTKPWKRTLVVATSEPEYTLGTPDIRSNVPEEMPTVAVVVAVPPVPAHATVYVVVAEGETAAEPLTRPPVEKPVPVQDVAFVEPHVSVELFPVTTVVGLALRLDVGGGAETVNV